MTLVLAIPSETDAVLGEGTFAVAYRVHGTQLVAKNYKAMPRGAFDEDFVREVAAYAALGAVYEPGWGVLPPLFGVDVSNPLQPALCVACAGDPFPVFAYKTWTPERLLHTSYGLLRAVAAFHAAGLVHRDIGHSNVLLGAGDAITIIDGGSVRGVAALAATLTTSTVCTFWYRSPELLSGAAGVVGAVQLDAWSTGVILLAHWTSAFVALENEAQQYTCLKRVFGTCVCDGADHTRCTGASSDVRTALRRAERRALPAPLASVITRLLHPCAATRLTPQAALLELGIAPIPLLHSVRARRARGHARSRRTMQRRGAVMVALIDLWLHESDTRRSAVLLFGAIALVDAAADAAADARSDAAAAVARTPPHLIAVAALRVAFATLAPSSPSFTCMLTVLNSRRREALRCTAAQRTAARRARRHVAKLRALKEKEHRGGGRVTRSAEEARATRAAETRDALTRAANTAAAELRAAENATGNLLTAIDYDVHGACGGADRNVGLAYPLRDVALDGTPEVAWTDACAALMEVACTAFWHTTRENVDALCAQVRALCE